MRIIAGRYGRRRFPLPKSFAGRPTTDLAKEGLFNILDNRVEWDCTRVLDLFSGTGSIGFEALSRGAKEVVAVEKNPHHVSFIKSVEEQLMNSHHKVYLRDVFKWLEAPPEQEPFQLIFADPPYALSNLRELPLILLNSSVLDPNGLLVVEHPRDYSFDEIEQFTEVRKYGSVNFSFFCV